MINKIKNGIKGKRILVTGVNGFIGSYLSRRLLQEGAILHGLAMKGTSLARIKELSRNITVHYGDLSDYKTVCSCVKKVKPQIIYHLAALRVVARDLKLVDSMIKTNIFGTLNMLKAVADEKIKLERFVNTGTCEEYGDGPAPFKESQREVPVSPYSASKVSVTYFCQMFYKTNNLPIVTLRPFLTYGAGQDLDLFIPSLIHSCLKGKDFFMTSGDQTREFNYIDDTVEGFLLAGSAPKAVGEIINIGNGREYKIRDVAVKIVRMMGNPIKLHFNAMPKRPGEAAHFFCDNKKAKQILGWRPRVGLDQGLEKTIAWFRAHPDFYSGCLPK
ncbi:MAG: SDR family NAD(P)-dependent oxidoreductase [Candidatus Omnitrophica bacterium]|nr:SDR family NAD(P)-dependent oxidoreductase [Candidatus Omnitrophota bacterium]